MHLLRSATALMSFERWSRSASIFCGSCPLLRWLDHRTISAEVIARVFLTISSYLSIGPYTWKNSRSG